MSLPKLRNKAPRNLEDWLLDLLHQLEQAFFRAKAVDDSAGLPREVRVAKGGDGNWHWEIFDGEWKRFS